MADKRGNYYVEWWNIKRSTIYGSLALVLFLAATAGGIWWAIRNGDNIAKQENTDLPKDAARLLSFEGEVRVIRAATRETILVTKETFLSAGDTVQTQADGKAQIKMIDGSMLSVRPNSTVVIRDSSSIFGGTNVRVALDDGQINVRTQDQTDQTQNVVEMQESENRLYSQTDASFNINDQNNGGEIRISRGSVDSTAGGEKTTLGENEFAKVSNGKLTAKERLLAPPTLVSPAQNAQIVASGNGNADASFRWEKNDSGASSFQLQIARSPFFVPDAMLLMRESLNSPTFSLANLTPGTYYWRVRVNSASGQSTDWSEPWRFNVVKSGANSALAANDFQVESVGGNIYFVSGKTQPGTIVRISGRETFATGDGSFRMQISSSAPETTVEISDERGNRNRYLLSLKTGKVIKEG